MRILSTTESFCIDTASDISSCSAYTDIFDGSTYLKSACMIATGANYSISDAACKSRGMKLYKFDTAKSQAAILNYAQTRVAPGSTYGWWVDAGSTTSCTMIYNGNGQFSSLVQPCTGGFWSICEYTISRKFKMFLKKIFISISNSQLRRLHRQHQV